MKKSSLFGLSVLLLVSPAAGQRSPAIEARHLPTYVTQLGKTHFPGGEAAVGDWPSAIVALRSGAVLIAGTTNGSIGEPHGGADDPDAFLARFDRLGNLDWVRQIGAITGPTIPALNGNPGGPGGDASKYDRAMDVAVASDGSIYVTGFTSGDLGETSSYSDMFLAKFDPHGSLQWLRQLGVETKSTFVAPWGGSLDMSSSSGGSSVIVDPAGDVYVAGQTYDDLAEPNGTRSGGIGSDVFLARFTANGRLQWLRQMGMLSSPQVGFDSWGEDYWPKIALHPSGSIVMACSSELWNPILPGGILDIDNYVTLFTFDAHGNPLASRGLPAPSLEIEACLTVDPRSGRIFLGGYTAGLIPEEESGSLDPFVASFDTNLEFEWVRQLGTHTAAQFGLLDITKNDGIGSICIDEAGDLILVGGTGGSWNEQNAPFSDVLTAKMRGSDGSLVWVSQIGKATSAQHGLSLKSSEGFVTGDLAPGGMIVLTGTTSGSLAEPHGGPGVSSGVAADVFVMRLTPDGKL